MAKKQKDEKRKEELDTQTTVADMNVEGFDWYDPKRKQKKKGRTDAPKLTKKEQRALIRGAYKAMLPMILCIAGGFLITYLLARLWLGCGA